MAMMKLYVFVGKALDKYSNILDERVRLRTRAFSDDKALNNLKFQWKTANKLTADASISLKGRMAVYDGGSGELLLKEMRV